MNGQYPRIGDMEKMRAGFEEGMRLMQTGHPEAGMILHVDEEKDLNKERPVRKPASLCDVNMAVGQRRIAKDQQPYYLISSCYFFTTLAMPTCLP